MASARQRVMDKIRKGDLQGDQATTWGAYQHYGEVNSKLLPFTNKDVKEANKARHNRRPLGKRPETTCRFSDDVDWATDFGWHTVERTSGK